MILKLKHIFMKKLLTILSVVVVFGIFLAACNGGNNANNNKTDTTKEIVEDNSKDESSETDTKINLTEFLLAPEMGWQKEGEEFFLTFMPDGSLHLQGAEGEASMAEGTWKLDGDKLTIVCEGMDINETKEIKEEHTSFLFGDVKYVVSTD